ncbi:stage III sporulation protein AF [Paludifilum halophilum]|uniref:Stage III sporulation protein AF n=1 Tax=Paludifilum halophilum TaxID=1642702 RepID=A0A235BCJ3_9BACL|nr:stage III sporulation protein AF [Paludifilum halophilum]
MNGWLKQIIILVLLATFMDLLLPNNAMDRYVKLVMGLLIILAILSPIFQLIRQDLDLTSLSDQQLEGSGRENLSSVKAIKQKGEQLTETQNRLIHEQAEQRMAATLRKGVEKRFPVEVIQSEVKTKGKEEARIEGVHLVVRRAADKGGEEAVDPVDPVDPVDIGMDSESRNKEDHQKDEPSSEQRALSRRIVQYVEETWKLPPEQIKVEVEDG